MKELIEKDEFIVVCGSCRANLNFWFSHKPSGTVEPGEELVCLLCGRHLKTTKCKIMTVWETEVIRQHTPEKNDVIEIEATSSLDGSRHAVLRYALGTRNPKNANVESSVWKNANTPTDCGKKWRYPGETNWRD